MTSAYIAIAMILKFCTSERAPQPRKKIVNIAQGPAGIALPLR